MTMLAHTLKDILELVPEALPLVKRASVDAEFPLDSKDSVIATALQLKYFEKVAYQPVDKHEFEKTAQAIRLYDVAKEVNQLSSKLIKAAKERDIAAENAKPENYFLKQASYEGDLGSLTIEERSSNARELYKQASEFKVEPSETVMLYSGHGWLSKQAAVEALAVRYHRTKDVEFVKLANDFGRTSDAFLTDDVLVEMSDKVAALDQQHGLNFKGFNFYKEAFFTKEAAFKSALLVKIAGKDVPYEKLEKLGREKIAAFIGNDVASEMDGGPANFKNVVETLPLDTQQLLNGLLKNV